MLALLVFAYPHGYEGAGSAFLVVLFLLALAGVYRALWRRPSSPRGKPPTPEKNSERRRRRRRRRSDTDWIAATIIVEADED